MKKTYKPNQDTKPILNMYEQRWLVSEKKVPMTYKNLDVMLKTVKEARRSLRTLELGAISTNGRELRTMLIGNCDSFEKDIEKIKKNHLSTRENIHHQYHSLTAGFLTSFQLFIDFYKEYVKR
ncbi:hypothetical protein [Peribacillus sp. SCS-37]|uniref:hypothetical protein n=1 Tax=Paraperibacillus esterisolvens TaxID=3115296 RepID=UPI003905FD71